MQQNIEAYSLDEAIEIFYESNELNLQEIILTDPIVNTNKYENLCLLFILELKKPGINENVNKTSLLDITTNGQKIWTSSYVVINRFNKLISNKKHSTKKDAVIEAREYTANNNINTKVILGKSAENFSRIQAEITYKPALNQKSGIYKFIW